MVHIVLTFPGLILFFRCLARRRDPDPPRLTNSGSRANAWILQYNCAIIVSNLFFRFEIDQTIKKILKQTVGRRRMRWRKLPQTIARMPRDAMRTGCAWRPCAGRLPLTWRTAGGAMDGRHLAQAVALLVGARWPTPAHGMCNLLATCWLAERLLDARCCAATCADLRNDARREICWRCPRPPSGDAPAMS
ncbi:Tir-nbs-lrr resistance protein [Dorcoceras hygrometricum]|uniref:Tir-nbs-lrr resistance protein n=1 Tax=Dorcoceras hygrometricum TaxID=472368 RepID=A0A2Z7C7X8_9LAMI|nr:Tir-nbs-lrr resistance protein [Dorcoceras hygrometricum]